MGHIIRKDGMENMKLTGRIMCRGQQIITYLMRYTVLRDKKKFGEP